MNTNSKGWIERKDSWGKDLGIQLRILKKNRLWRRAKTRGHPGDFLLYGIDFSPTCSLDRGSWWVYLPKSRLRALWGGRPSWSEDYNAHNFLVRFFTMFCILLRSSNTFCFFLSKSTPELPHWEILSWPGIIQNRRQSRNLLSLAPEDVCV